MSGFFLLRFADPTITFYTDANLQATHDKSYAEIPIGHGSSNQANCDESDTKPNGLASEQPQGSIFNFIFHGLCILLASFMELENFL